MYTGIGQSLGTDYFRIADQLTGDEPRYLRRARDLVDSEVPAAGAAKAGAARAQQRAKGTAAAPQLSRTRTGAPRA